MMLPNAEIIYKIDIGNKKVVLYDPMCHIKNNIFCLDSEGKVVWQASRNPIGKLVEFTWLGIKNNDLIAVDFWGTEYKLNHIDGTTEITRTVK